MTTQRNFQGAQPKYKTPGIGGDFVNHAQSNFDGGRTTKKGGGKSMRQMNYGGTVSIPVKFEKGQGQKQGTGSQGGY